MNTKYTEQTSYTEELPDGKHTYGKHGMRELQNTATDFKKY